MTLEKNILIVDDDEFIRKLLESILSSSGYNTKLCKSGLEALYELNQTWETYDLIITDNQMPELTGTDLVTRIRNKGDSTPVLMISGTPALDNGFINEFLTKPVEKQTVLACVEKLTSEKNSS